MGNMHYSSTSGSIFIPGALQIDLLTYLLTYRYKTTNMYM